MTVVEFADHFPEGSEITVAYADKEWHVGVVLPSGAHVFASDANYDGAIESALIQEPQPSPYRKLPRTLRIVH